MNPLRSVTAVTEAARTIRDVQRTLTRAALLSEANLTADAAAAFGINAESSTVTRTQAMSVSAVKRGRNVICGVIGSLPLQHLDASGRRIRDGRRRTWIEQPESARPLVGTLTWTVDDLIFNGLSWWIVRGRYSDNFPAEFERVERDRVTVIAATPRRPAELYVDGRKVDDRDVVRIDGPDEGLLRNGGRTLQTAIMLEQATKRLAKLDVPLGYLRPAEGAQSISTEEGSANDPTDETLSEAEALLDTWEQSRAERNTAFLNRAIEYVQTQLDATKIQLNEQRESSRVDIANMLNLEPRYVAAPNGDSSTYATTEANRRELIDISLAPYLNAIEQRLSMRDVTPRGQRIRFARASWMRGDLATVMQAVSIARELGVIDDDEIRTEYLGLPPRESDESEEA